MVRVPKARAAKRSTGRRPGQSNLVRIVGGVHGGRKLTFPNAPGLRPTSDRVRETLFNWLQPVIQGACCLDLFAGSGAIGLEAASRGARKVVLVEQHPRVVEQLRANYRLLGLDQVEVVQSDAIKWLQHSPVTQFDILFLDPPFAAGLLGRACELLDRGGWLGADARIYLEMDAADPLPKLPSTWRQLKARRAGQVSYYLYTCLR